MNVATKTAIAAAALAVSLASPVFGQDTSPSPSPVDLPTRRINRENIIRQYDKNGDGIIDASERQAARNALNKKLDRPPEAEAAATNAPGRQEIFRRLDVNGDGKIDDQERAALRTELAKARSITSTNEVSSIRRPVFNRQTILKQYDKDGDGRLSDAERQAAVRGMRSQFRGTNSTNAVARGPREDMVKRFDGNGDGVIDDKERAAALEAVRKRNVNGRYSPEPAVQETSKPTTEKSSPAKQD